MELRHTNRIAYIKDKVCLFHLGDLVSLKTHPLHNGTDIRLGENIQADPHAIPPAMVIIEVVKDIGKDKIKYDEETGEKISGGIFKYRCQFYATQEGKFKDFLFYGDVLAPITFYKFSNLTFKVELGQRINFRSFNFEFGKTKQSLIISKSSSRVETAFTNEITVVPLLTHLPPSLIITGIEKNKIETPIFKTNSKGDREVIREVSLYKIKCMWYNPIDAKFSEDWFIPEALIEVK